MSATIPEVNPEAFQKAQEAVRKMLSSTKSPHVIRLEIIADEMNRTVELIRLKTEARESCYDDEKHLSLLREKFLFSLDEIK